MLVAELQRRHYQAELCQHVPSASKLVISLLAWQNFTTAENAIASNYQNFNLARQIASRFQEQGGSFIIVQDAGLFGQQAAEPAQAWSAGSSGLIKTAAHEWPKATVKIIDIAYQQQNLQAALWRIIEELVNGSPEIEIALGPNGQRLVLDINEDKNLGEYQQTLSINSVLLVSGGGRGVTAHCLIELAQRYKSRIAILGRTSLEPEADIYNTAHNEAELKALLVNLAKNSGATTLNLREIQQQAREILARREILATLTAIQKAGSEVMYLRADVQNQDELAQAITSIHQRWGAITGLIHGAGVLADKQIKDQTDAQFTQVFNTKVQGLYALLKATRQEPLRLIALFSSVAGRFGNAGQCAYAMANEILNKVAGQEQRQRGNSCLVKAINWGPWEGGMVSAELTEHFRQNHIHLLPLATGSQLFAEEMQHYAANQSEVVVGGGSLMPEWPMLAVYALKNQPQPVMSFYVQQDSHSFLLDHSIKNLAVIPLCMVIDWFLRAGQYYYPQQEIRILEQLRVLKALRLDQFQAGMTFSIFAEETPQQLKLKLCSATGQAHYTATIPLGLSLPDFQELSLPEGDPWPWTPAQAYQEKKIFHGPAFQVLENLSNFSLQEGCRGRVSGILAMSAINPSWLYEPWLLDVAALDGGLQMGSLWNVATIGMTLPVSIKRFVLYRKGLIQDSIEVCSKITAHSRLHCEGIVQYYDRQGPIAVMEGIEGIVMPT